MLRAKCLPKGQVAAWCGPLSALVESDHTHIGCPRDQEHIRVYVSPVLRTVIPAPSVMRSCISSSRSIRINYTEKEDIRRELRIDTCPIPFKEGRGYTASLHIRARRRISFFFLFWTLFFFLNDLGFALFSGLVRAAETFRALLRLGKTFPLVSLLEPLLLSNVGFIRGQTSLIISSFFQS